jgi:hypothetical protein
MVFSPRAWRANFMAMVAPHPGQPRCPGFIKSLYFKIPAFALSMGTSSKKNNFKFTAEALRAQRELSFSFAFERKANEKQSAYGKRCIGTH